VLRRFVASIEISPTAPRQPPIVTVRGVIAEMGFPAGNEPGARVTVVAEGMGFEPTIGVFPL
jgi:hypothetical protein